jgi:hypothetical protein
VDISGHGGIDEQDVGWRNGWSWWGFWLRRCGIVADLTSEAPKIWWHSLISSYAQPGMHKNTARYETLMARRALLNM